MSAQPGPTAVLLDTCVLLWLIATPERLPAPVRERLTCGDTDVFVSTATLWETLVKYRKGKLGLQTQGRSALDFLVDACTAHRLELLPISVSTLEPLEKLPAIHHDPFDRMLICQAIAHGLTLLTPDPEIRRYPIKTFW